MRPLEELERFDPDGSSPNPFVPSEIVTQLRVSLARIEGKLDNLIGLSTVVETLREDLVNAETRVTKLESWNKFAVWLFGVVQSVVLVVVAAALAYYWHR